MEGGDSAAERLGGKIMRALESRGYVAVSAEEAGLWGHMLSQNEMMMATLHVLAGSANPDTRLLASNAMRRVTLSDGGTPFDDLRMQVKNLENENKRLRESIERAENCLKPQ